MEAEEECVLSIATARPGVLVSAPAISPTRLGVSIPTTYLSIKPVRLAEPTIRSVSMISVFPFERKESKNPGPACMPMVKINNTKPKFPSSLGMITPKCPNRRAIKITADTSRERPLICILPNMNPKAIIRNKAK